MTTGATGLSSTEFRNRRRFAPQKRTCIDCNKQTNVWETKNPVITKYVEIAIMGMNGGVTLANASRDGKPLEMGKRGTYSKMGHRTAWTVVMNAEPL